MIEKLSEEIDSILMFRRIKGLAIFRDWIIEQASINPAKAKQCRFYYDVDNSKKLAFKVEGFDDCDKSKILQFFGIGHEPEYPEINLDEDLIFGHFLPHFKEYIEKITYEQPEKLEFYQRLSQCEITKELIEKLAEAIQLMIKKVNEAPLKGLDEPAYGQLISLLNAARTCIKSPDNYCTKTPLIDIQKKINQWFESSSNIFLRSSWYNLDQEISHFIQVNCLENQYKTGQFFYKLDGYLMNLKIDIQAGNAFTELLLRMIGIKQAVTDSKFVQYSRNPTQIFWRLDFKQTAESDEAIAKLLNFFHEQGDQHGFIAYQKKFDAQRQDHGYRNYIDAKQARYELSQCRLYDNPGVTYGLRLDGTVCLEKILPLFKNYVDNLNAQELKPYVDASASSGRVMARITIERQQFFKPNQAMEVNQDPGPVISLG